MKDKQEMCPNCGYCPHCGRAPVKTTPWWPYYPWTYPWYTSTHTYAADVTWTWNNNAISM